MPLHPKIDDQTERCYGEWNEGWIDAVGYEGRYQVNHLAEVKNKKTGKILKPINTGRVTLTDNYGKNNKRRVYHLVLESFFPHISRNGRTCDHIDENHQNNHVTNLWWQTRPQNSNKSNQLRPRNHGPAQSKSISQWSKDRLLHIADFPSIKEASRKTQLSVGDISNCALGRRPSAGGYFWQFQQVISQNDLPDEIWETNDTLKAMLRQRNEKMSIRAINQVRISNMGRILTAKGLKTKGKKMNDRGTGHREYKVWQVHQLVWAVFGNALVPKKGEGLIICHNDSIPKDDEGCVSNAIAHLRLDTHSENQKEYLREKAKKRTFTDLQNS